MFGVSIANENQKFEVVFTVKYNAITLAEAAEKEKEFRERYKDACSVEISLKKTNGNIDMLSVDATDFLIITNDGIEIDWNRQP